MPFPGGKGHMWFSFTICGPLFDNNCGPFWVDIYRYFNGNY